LLASERRQWLIGVAINNVLHNLPVRVFGSQGNVRDYVHVSDICTIAARAAWRREPFTILNVGSGRGYSVKEVLSMIEACAKVPLRIEPLDQKGDYGRWLTDWVVLDILKAREEFNWTPRVDLLAGIKGMFDSALTVGPY
jgi:UDP-glucose 4-epimerase